MQHAAFLSNLLALLLAAPTVLTAQQERVAWLGEHGVPIRSHKHDDEDFKDLEPLIAKIGKARIVMLGEQSHGDGKVFELKCRLVRFLHQRMGFDVLAWESGLLGCREADRALLETDMPLAEAAERGVFRIWTLSKQVMPVFAYARSTKDSPLPLRTAGFDSQLTSQWMRENTADTLIDFIDAADPKILDEGWRKTFRSWVQNLGRRPRATNMGKKLLEFLDAPALALRHSPRELAFMKHVADNLHQFERQSIATADRQNMDVKELYAIRDGAMGKNLNWLAEEYFRGHKIIVWAASTHIMRDVPQERVGPGQAMQRIVAMGEHVCKRFGDAAYTIAFDAYDGKRGVAFNPRHGDIPPAPEGSFAALCKQTGKEMLFVDFKGLSKDHWLRQPLVARPRGYGQMKAVWPDVFDAMIYTETMTPATRRD